MEDIEYMIEQKKKGIAQKREVVEKEQQKIGELQAQLDVLKQALAAVAVKKPEQKKKKEKEKPNRELIEP